LFKDDTVVGEGDRTTLELANFQHEGFERAVKLIEKHRGCIVADAVGLGKTFIGLRVLDYYLIKLRRPKYVPRALVICPAQLRDLVWTKRLDEFGIKADIVSQEELSRKTFDITKYRYHDIVLVDESHNFRNSGTGRYANIQKLLGTGKRDKIVLLLTATPINNSIFDLYHQLSLLTRSQDSYYYAEGINNLKTFFQALSKREVESTELLMQTIVRRSRQDVIRRQETGEVIKINGQEIKFPKRQLAQFTYNFEDTFAGLYAGLANQIDQLHLAPYNLKEFKQKQDRNDENEIKRNAALVALQKALYLKRLESSLIAFKKSIQNQRDFQTYFAQFLEQGKLLDSKKFRKFIMGAIDDDDDTFDPNAVGALLEPIAVKEYKIDALKQQITQDTITLNSIVDILNKIETQIEADSDYDKKLVAFKQLLAEQLKGQKTLVFFYYKDTANYVYDCLLKDSKWLAEMGNPKIELITGDTAPGARTQKIQRFAPKANAEELEKRGETITDPIDILLSTDVLSEGQNLQDAGMLVNYSLHWNPVRMIQRAGRIDRLGSEFENLMIYNCFPEEGLEDLLDLVKRLQRRIEDIDREIGLDASVLGEAIQGKSLEELIKLKQADTDEEKAAILAELEDLSDLVSLDEMRLPLLEYIQNRQAKEIEDIPYGVHSTYHFDIPGKEFKEGGLFLAFRIHDYHHWMVYPRIQGANDTKVISTDYVVTDKRKIFNWLKCSESDFPAPEELPPQIFDKGIFRILESATDNLLEYYKQKHTSSKLKPKLSKVLQTINHLLGEVLSYQDTLVQTNLFQPTQVQLALNFDSEIDPKTVKLIQKIITNQNLRIHENMIKQFWETFKKNQNVTQLIENLDVYFDENELYHEAEALEPPKIEIVKRENIKLVTYQWFYPTI
jgi:superfamily II DNA or RNA helicase